MAQVVVGTCQIPIFWYDLTSILNNYKQGIKTTMQFQHLFQEPSVIMISCINYQRTCYCNSSLATHEQNLLKKVHLKNYASTFEFFEDLIIDIWKFDVFLDGPLQLSVTYCTHVSHLPKGCTHTYALEILLDIFSMHKYH